MLVCALANFFGCDCGGAETRTWTSLFPAVLLLAGGWGWGQNTGWPGGKRRYEQEYGVGSIKSRVKLILELYFGGKTE